MKAGTIWGPTPMAEIRCRQANGVAAQRREPVGIGGHDHMGTSALTGPWRAMPSDFLTRARLGRSRQVSWSVCAEVAWPQQSGQIWLTPRRCGYWTARLSQALGRLGGMVCPAVLPAGGQLRPAGTCSWPTSPLGPLAWTSGCIRPSSTPSDQAPCAATCPAGGAAAIATRSMTELALELLEPSRPWGWATSRPKVAWDDAVRDVAVLCGQSLVGLGTSALPVAGALPGSTSTVWILADGLDQSRCQASLLPPQAQGQGPTSVVPWRLKSPSPDPWLGRR